MYKDQYYMKEALQLAAKAEGYTSPNPMVGAVVVKDGRIVGCGYHQKAGTPHAEVHALKDAGVKAEGATIYVTLEPCCHYGRTPPCTEAIKNAGVNRVVVAITDPNPLVAGKGLNVLKEAGIEVTSGVLASEATKLNEVFIKYITTKMPFVVLKAAVSLDGKIATVGGESQWITGPESRLYAHRLRHKYDGILVGINTILDDDPSLTTRLPEGDGVDPVRIVLDSKCRTPVNAKIINQSSKAKTIIAVTEAADKNKITALKKAGVEVLVINDQEGMVNLDQLLRRLGEMQITSLLVEGGSGVHGSFLTAGVIDKVYWFIAPMLIGGRDAPGAVAGSGIKELTAAVRLNQPRVNRFGADICIEGNIDQGGGA
ncbi:MAG: bifunctional diaminohydroxyphosphoribosylaminopyrimidine deaminase/5-amino-6-(5-phosphoribosylamino)uracil reductase RibD [Firmicutes bacterium]|nr:bifunctional diaminohydroxyphosphoribosylaminopyrimidine deaminase/5-amino-6-(5-phosphoribosylamino)uracil reductase RibD [Bacillota bacterium]